MSSYLLDGLGDADRRLLEAMPEDSSLAGEIAFLRLRIRRAAENERVNDALLLRMLSLLTRMVAAQTKLADEAPDDLAALNELVRQRLAAGASADEAAG
jgi:hypothetical protein